LIVDPREDDPTSRTPYASRCAQPPRQGERLGEDKKMHHAHKIRAADIVNPDLISQWVLIGGVVAIVGVLVALLQVLLSFRHY
jgi:hypothetical protein